MTRRPAVKLKLVKSDVADSALPGRRNPRSLVPLDWYAAGILCALIIIAPLVAGDFATSSGVLPVESAWSLFTAIGVPILLILAALAYLPFAWREWTKPVAIGEVSGLAPSFTLLVVWAALSALRSPALYLTVNALAVLCAAVMSAGLISRLARDRSAMVALLVSLTIGGTMVAAIGVSEYIGYLLLHAPDHRSFSTFSDPNFLAGYLLLTIPIALSLFGSSDDLRLKWLSGVSIIIQSSALWLSGSRAASAVVLVEIAIFVGLALFVRASNTSTRWVSIGLALFVIGSLPALTPLFSRLVHAAPARTGHVVTGAGVASGDAQVNSNEFRRWTWIGTARMARANPLLGTGFGAFDLSYARYAETAFTAHAHNSYLQLMSETGYPGVLLVLVGLAAAAAFAANSLLLLRRRAAEAGAGSASKLGDSHDGGQAFHLLLRAPDVVLVGLVAALAGSMLHSLLDSDWYVAANAITIAAVTALTIAFARDLAPLSTRRPAPLSKAILTIGAVVALLLLWRGAQLASSRMNESLGMTDVELTSSSNTSEETKLTNLSQAADAYRAAAAADPLDPEPHLGLAEVATSQEARLKELNAAISLSQSGKAYYRLGQYYMNLSQWAPAYEAFERARSFEPKMLQNLHALAGAYLAAGKTDDEERILQTMAALQLTPYGQVRAMHESVETDFGYAHAMLGDIDVKRSDWQGAAHQYEMARDVLSEYWSGRNYLVNIQGRSTAKRKELADLFENVLQQLQTSYIRLNRPVDAQTASVKLDAVRKDRAIDGGAEPTSPAASPPQ